MTYCVGLLLNDGMVLLSDTRTNAGLDNIAIYRKIGQMSFDLRSPYTFKISKSFEAKIRHKGVDVANVCFLRIELVTDNS